MFHEFIYEFGCAKVPDEADLCYLCQDMLQNVDEIISLPFPINGVFNRRLTNIEVGFILQPFFLVIITDK